MEWEILVAAITTVGVLAAVKEAREKRLAARNEKGGSQSAQGDPPAGTDR